MFHTGSAIFFHPVDYPANNSMLCQNRSTEPVASPLIIIGFAFLRFDINVNGSDFRNFYLCLNLFDDNFICHGLVGQALEHKVWDNLFLMGLACNRFLCSLFCSLSSGYWHFCCEELTCLFCVCRILFIRNYRCFCYSHFNTVFSAMVFSFLLLGICFSLHNISNWLPDLDSNETTL